MGGPENGIDEGGLSVIDMRNDSYVADAVRLCHEVPAFRICPLPQGAGDIILHKKEKNSGAKKILEKAFFSVDKKYKIRSGELFREKSPGTERNGGIFMQVQVVVDNYTENRNLLGEHGLSQILRTPRGTLLFDAGQGRALEQNLSMLGISGSDLDFLVCSHGHYDHTWGIPVLLRQGWNIPLYGHVACGVERFGLRRGVRVPLGFSLAQVTTLFHSLQGAEELLPGVYALVVPPERRDPAFVPFTPSLQVRNQKGEWIPDPFEDDLSLLVEGRFGWSLLLGCAHSGVVNILDEAVRRTGSRSFHVVQGGMHLKGQSGEFVEKVLHALEERFEVRQWRPNHCTGVDVALTMAKRFSPVSWAAAGSSVEL